MPEIRTCKSIKNQYLSGYEKKRANQTNLQVNYEGDQIDAYREGLVIGSNAQTG